MPSVSLPPKENALFKRILVSESGGEPSGRLARPLPLVKRRELQPSLLRWDGT